MLRSWQDGWPCLPFQITVDVPLLVGFGTNSADGVVARGLHCFSEGSEAVARLITEWPRHLHEEEPLTHTLTLSPQGRGEGTGTCEHDNARR